MCLPLQQVNVKIACNNTGMFLVWYFTQSGINHWFELSPYRYIVPHRPVVSTVWTHMQPSPSCKLKTGSRQDKTLFTPHFETGQNSFEIFCRRQSWLVANSVQTAVRRHRQDKTVLSCPYRWCKLSIRVYCSRFFTRFARNFDNTERVQSQCRSN